METKPDTKAPVLQQAVEKIGAALISLDEGHTALAASFLKEAIKEIQQS